MASTMVDAAYAAAGGPPTTSDKSGGRLKPGEDPGGGAGVADTASGLANGAGKRNAKKCCNAGFAGGPKPPLSPHYRDPEKDRQHKRQERISIAR